MSFINNFKRISWDAIIFAGLFALLSFTVIGLVIATIYIKNYGKPIFDPTVEPQYEVILSDWPRSDGVVIKFSNNTVDCYMGSNGKTLSCVKVR